MTYPIHIKSFKLKTFSTLFGFLFVLISFNDLTANDNTGIENETIIPKCGTPLVHEFLHNNSTVNIRELFSSDDFDSDQIDFLARPTGLDQYYDSGFLRFHYTLDGNSAVDPSDSDTDGTPDYVENMASVFQMVIDNEITEFGFTQPPGDGWYTFNDNGGSDDYDIYIKTLGAGYYGFVRSEYYASNTGDNENSEVIELNARTSFMEMRNEYGGFPLGETESIMVTAAHEFFHAIQYGYDYFNNNDIWMLEATSTWIEDEVYDDVNDNYQYLLGWFDEPNTALDEYSFHVYGSFIFFRYLSEHIDGINTILKIFDYALPNTFLNTISFTSIEDALNDYDTNFDNEFKNMIISNLLLTDSEEAKPYTYEEAQGYRDYGIEPEFEEVIDVPNEGTTFGYFGNDLMHRACHYLQIENPTPMVITFIPSEANDNVSALVVLKTSDDNVYTYNLENSKEISIPSNTENFYIVILTGDDETAVNQYSIEFSPSLLSLNQNYPNPFNPIKELTTFDVYVPESGSASFNIYNILGMKVDGFVLTELETGLNEVTYTGKYLPSGVYIMQLKNSGKKKARRFTIIK
tara:strand:- start:3527 stop:5254 length:1728 start_codon:yes stop_codon:yes gene_type:complete